MMEQRTVTPLTRQRAVMTMLVIIDALKSGEAGVTYTDLSTRLGMSRVNGQGLASYLTEAAAICAEQGWPNLSVMVVSRESLDAGQPMPSDGSLSDGFFAASGLTMASVPAEQARVRGFDWAGVDLGALE